MKEAGLEYFIAKLHLLKSTLNYGLIKQMSLTDSNKLKKYILCANLKRLPLQMFAQTKLLKIAQRVLRSRSSN